MKISFPLSLKVSLWLLLNLVIVGAGAGLLFVTPGGIGWATLVNGTAGARAVGTLLVAGMPRWPAGAGERPGVHWAWSALDGPGAVLLAVGDPGAVTAVLDEAALTVAAS